MNSELLFINIANTFTVTPSYDHGGSVDALKAITQSTLSQEYNLAISGGN